jgi:hypothetical protein
MLRLQSTIEDSNQLLNILPVSPVPVEDYNNTNQTYKKRPDTIEIVWQRDSNHFQDGPVEEQDTCAEKEWQQFSGIHFAVRSTQWLCFVRNFKQPQASSSNLQLKQTVPSV